MMNLQPYISSIEALLNESSEANLTYAALECRLAIEFICYERLRIAHDYISHDDLKKWQPAQIVKTLIKEVDTHTAATFTLSVAKDPFQKDTVQPNLVDCEAMEMVEVGTQIGFDPKKLGELWNGLSNLALHTVVPTSKANSIKHYGDADGIRAKVLESLREIKRISEGTLIMSGIGEEVSFDCPCGVKNKRKLGMLKNGKIISCINPSCDESYEFVENDLTFGRRTFNVVCQKCAKEQVICKRSMEKLRTDQRIHFFCVNCGDEISVMWKPMQTQKSMGAP